MKKKASLVSSALCPDRRHMLALTHFDVKLQVFIHRIYVVKNVLHYPGDDSHRVCVMEISLRSRGRSLAARQANVPKQKHRGQLLPPWCVFSPMMSDHMQKSSRCIRPRHLQATKKFVRIQKRHFGLVYFIGSVGLRDL